MSEEFGKDIITLTDEEDNEFEFEILDMAEIDGQVYSALMPIHNNPTDLLDADGQFVVLKVIENEDGEEILEGIDDEAELEKVIKVFEEQLSEEFTLES